MAADQQARASDTLLGRDKPGEHKLHEPRQCVKAIGAAVTRLTGLAAPDMCHPWL
jgi:hypothetical protein